MEFRLNKIDTELRQIVNEAIKEGKVHGNKESSNINRYGKEEENENSKDFNGKSKKLKIKKITVEAKKINDISIEASKENFKLDSGFGRFLDTKR